MLFGFGESTVLKQSETGQNFRFAGIGIFNPLVSFRQIVFRHETVVHMLHDFRGFGKPAEILLFRRRFRTERFDRQRDLKLQVSHRNLPVADFDARLFRRQHQLARHLFGLLPVNVGIFLPHRPHNDVFGTVQLVLTVHLHIAQPLQTLLLQFSFVFGFVHDKTSVMINQFPTSSKIIFASSARIILSITQLLICSILSSSTPIACPTRPINRVSSSVKTSSA